MYTRVQADRGKDARMNYKKLEKIVLDIVTVKNLKGMDELGY